MRLACVILLLICISCNLSSWEKRKLKKNFGASFNKQRKRLGAHPVTGGMRLHENIYYNPIEQKELDYEFAIVREHTVIRLQDTRDPGRIIMYDDPGISFQMADSILMAWGIEPPEHL